MKAIVTELTIFLQNREVKCLVFNVKETALGATFSRSNVAREDIQRKRVYCSYVTGLGTNMGTTIQFSSVQNFRQSQPIRL